MSRCIRKIKESFGRKVSLRVQFNQLYDIGGTCSFSTTCSHHKKTKTKSKENTKTKTKINIQIKGGLKIHVVVVREVCGRQKILWDFVVKAIFGKAPIRWKRKRNTMLPIGLYCFLEALEYFLRHFFTSTFVLQTVSCTENKRQQAKRFE